MKRENQNEHTTNETKNGKGERAIQGVVRALESDFED